MTSSTAVQRLRDRYESTAGFTRSIYMPEDRDLDLVAADLIERQQAELMHLREDNGRQIRERLRQPGRCLHD